MKRIVVIGFLLFILCYTVTNAEKTHEVSTDQLYEMLINVNFDRMVLDLDYNEDVRSEFLRLIRSPRRPSYGRNSKVYFLDFRRSRGPGDPPGILPAMWGDYGVSLKKQSIVAIPHFLLGYESKAIKDYPEMLEYMMQHNLNMFVRLVLAKDDEELLTGREEMNQP